MVLELQTPQLGALLRAPGGVSAPEFGGLPAIYYALATAGRLPI